MRTEQVTLTNMCMVYDDDGNVLVQDKVDNDWGGLTFPGGHIEKGESFVDSVIREVYEESGLKIENPRICGTKDWMEKDGSRWIPLEEMKKGNLAMDMDDMLKVFLEDDISEFHYTVENGQWKHELK